MIPIPAFTIHKIDNITHFILIFFNTFLYNYDPSYTYFM